MLKTQLTPELYAYCLEKGVREHPELVNLRIETNRLTNCHMLITPDQGAVLAFLVKLIRAKKYIEIGVFTGYSTLWAALAMPKDAIITALDISDQHLGLARKYWKAAEVEYKINTIIAPAADTLADLALNAKNSYDMAFIDANKSEYIDYYEYCLSLVRPGGLIVMDNILMHGGVLEINSSKNYIKILQQLNDLVLNDTRVNMCLLPIGDGMTLVQKKDVTINET